MKLRTTLFVREFHGGAVLVQVLAEPSVVVFALDEEDAVLDISLLLEDRLRRTHPRDLHRVVSPDNARFVQWDLDDALRVRVPEGDDLRRRLTVSALLSRHKDHQRVHLPTWELRCWEPIHGDEEEAALEVLGEHVAGLATGEVLDRRIQVGERVRVLELEFEPAPLAAFTGRFLGAARLPEVVPEGESRAAERERRRVPTPALDQLADDLTQRARDRQLPRAAGVSELVERLQTELTANDRACAVVIGAPSIGKTALILELAHHLPKDTPDKFARRMWSADAKRLIASRGALSDWRGQVLDVLEEVHTADAIWFVGDLIALLDAGKSAQSEDNVAQLLAPHLARRRVRVVAECTPAEWSRVQRRAPSLARSFAPLRIEEPSEPRSLHILRGFAALRTEGTPLSVTEAAVVAARELGSRYGSGESVHANAIGLLRRTINDRLAELEPSGAVDRSSLVDTFCRESGMPSALVRDDTDLDLESVRAFFAERIRGQPTAVERMAELVGMIKAGLADPTRPLGSFLFVGPTGVGKTETAKTLAAYLFGSSARMVRFDMAEIVTADAVARFVGRHGRPGKLVSEVRRAPFTVVLLDEIEKAHPAVFDVLLQVLGEARLSDEAGRTASFRNAVVIMTSNLGAQTRRAAVGFGDGRAASWSDHYVGEAKRSFRPELFNRIDHVVPFEALPAAAIRAIADRQLDALRRRQGLHQRGLSLSIPGDVASWLAERGTDPRFGARPLKRSIETNLVAPLARHLSGLGRVHAGEISARKTGDGLDIALTPSDASQRAGLESLHRRVEQIGELRLLLQGCVRSPAIRDLRIEVRRVERMLANPRFVRGHASLLQAMSGHEADRQLLSDIHTLVAHTESLEELAYEMRLARDVGSMESLGRERREGLQKLRELGLKLSGRGVQSPDRAALVFSWRKQPRLLSTLVRAYASLASEMQWSVALHEPTEVPRAEVEDATELSYTLEERIRLEPAQLSQSRQRRLVPDEPMATLVFRGPAAGTLLAGEAGLHRLHDRDGGTEEVRVGHASDMFLAGVYTDDELVRARAKLPRSLVRVIHHGRRTVEDKHLGLHFALEPRLERIYQRFMYARVFDTVFFRGAHRVLRRV